MKRPTLKISQQQNRFPIIFYEILSKRKDCRSFCIIFRCFSVDVSCDENVLKNILSQLFVWCYFVSPFLIDCDFFVSLYVTSLRGLVVTSPQKEMVFLRTTLFQKALLTLPLLHFTTVWLNSKEKFFLFTFNFFWNASIVTSSGRHLLLNKPKQIESHYLLHEHIFKNNCFFFNLTLIFIFPRCVTLLEQFGRVVPYPEEVFVSSEDGRFGVGLDISIHVCLSHPGGESLCCAETQGRSVVVFPLGFGLLFVVIWNKSDRFINCVIIFL